MPKIKLEESINMRIQLKDMKKLKEIADVKRMPVSTYCRTIIGEHLETA